MTSLTAPARWETDLFVLRSWLPGDGPLIYEALIEASEAVAREVPVASRRTAESGGSALQGILRRDGYTPDGALRDTCIYALLHEERANAPHPRSAP